MRLVCLIFCGLLLFAQAKAQPVSANLAIRYVKLGNTLREAKQYAQAKDYLEKALGVLQKAGDRYWTAAAYENLGLIDRDLSETASATRNLTKALDLYRATRASASAKVVQQMLGGVANPKADQEIYGGIDIGARGVKMSVVALRFSPDGKSTLVVLKSDTRNTLAINGKPEDFAATADAVKAYLDSLMIGRKIPRERVFVVGSSGLRTELERPENTGKLDELTRTIQAKLGASWPNPVPFIDAKKEAELTIRGMLVESEWRTTATIDIGTGNTKGGYFLSDNSFEYTAFLGTGSVLKYIQEEKRPVAESAQAIYSDAFRQTVASNIERRPEFQSRKRVYVVGGIVYALVTYLHPRHVNNEQVQFTYKDAVHFQEMAIKDYNALTNPDLSGIDSDATFKKAQSEVRNVRERVFKNRDDLIAGATLLRGILEECRRGGDDEKEFVFHRNGVIGWISGYIIEARAKAFKQVQDQ